MRRVAAAISIVAACASLRVFAQHPPMPPGMTHEEHLAQMQRDSELKTRGAAAMGFDQERTTHHFRLHADGGAIEVVAKESGDSPTIGQVRAHLKETAEAFARGDFGKPVATHAETPPGVLMMQQRRNALSFRYADIASGGHIRITSPDPQAVAGVHEFLRYQIREHATGDSLQITNAR